MVELRLMFWVEGYLASKFLSSIIPEVGQVWIVPVGEHNLDTRKEGNIAVRVMYVEVEPYDTDEWDVHIQADITEPYRSYHDIVRLSPDGFVRPP